MKIWNDQLLTMDALYRLSYNGNTIIIKQGLTTKTRFQSNYDNFAIFFKSNYNRKKQ
jgi:hypothetical protein